MHSPWSILKTNFIAKVSQTIPMTHLFKLAFSTRSTRTWRRSRAMRQPMLISWPRHSRVLVCPLSRNARTASHLQTQSLLLLFLLCWKVLSIHSAFSFLFHSWKIAGVGVSAYLGAAADIANPNYLTAAGSILTIEARHSAYIRSGLAESPFPSPFDTPLDPNEVYTLASPFIVSCPPENPQLPLKSFPSLALATEGKITTGSTITLATPGYTLKPRNDRAKLYAAFVSVTGPVFVDVTPVTDGFSVRVPTGVAGQSYIIFTKCNETVSDDTVVAGPAIVEVISFEEKHGIKANRLLRWQAEISPMICWRFLGYIIFATRILTFVFFHIRPTLRDLFEIILLSG